LPSRRSIGPAATTSSPTSPGCCATYERIRRARIELIRADTTEERLVIESRISALEATADAQQAELNGVERQGRFATVNVDVTASGPGSGQDGDWSLGEALDDAGRVLEVIGGIALVGLAVLVPLAALGALAWLIATRIRHRRRERALDAESQRGATPRPARSRPCGRRRRGRTRYRGSR
jgi:Domain of unknown function (DUF4349)